MKLKLYEDYKRLPNWSQGVIGIVVVAGTAVAIWAIVRGIKNRKELAEANQAAKAASSELQGLKARGINPTMDVSEFEALSQKLVQAMNGCGTNEDQVYDVFRAIKNEADIRQLIITFGVRYYEPCAADQPISYIRWQFNDQAFGGGLPTWLSYDLSASEIQEINKILKKNNINYSF